MNYAERMRNLRQDNDLSQKKVADMLGVAQTTYSQYELEKRPMPIDYLIALCKFYNVSADYMLGLSNRKNTIYSVSVTLAPMPHQPVRSRCSGHPARHCFLKVHNQRKLLFIHAFQQFLHDFHTRL